MGGPTNSAPLINGTGGKHHRRGEVRFDGRIEHPSIRTGGERGAVRKHHQVGHDSVRIVRGRGQLERIADILGVAAGHRQIDDRQEVLRTQNEIRRRVKGFELVIGIDDAVKHAGTSGENHDGEKISRHRQESVRERDAECAAQV